MARTRRADWVRTIRSPGPTAPLASTRAITTSTSSSDEVADSFIRSPSAVRGLCSPGVSTKHHLGAGAVERPRAPGTGWCWAGAR